MTLTPQEVVELNKGRFTFRKEHSSTEYAGYKRLPGHVLIEEFIAPYYPANLSDLSKRTGIPLYRFERLIRGNDRIDKTMAEALGKFYHNGAEFWLDIQERFERGEKL